MPFSEGNAQQPSATSGNLLGEAHTEAHGSRRLTLTPGRLISGCNFWCKARDGDAECYAMARRHYSAEKNANPKIKQFVGPGLRTLMRSAASSLFPDPPSFLPAGDWGGNVSTATGYQEFLDSKSQVGGMSGFEPNWMPDFLFDFQRSLVD